MEFDELFGRPAVLAAFVVLCIFFYQFLHAYKLPDLPIVGAKPGEWFPLQRAKWRNFMNPEAATRIAYEEYGDRACIFPMAGAQTFLHLPHKELQWLVDSADTDINALAQIINSLQLHRTLMDPKLAYQPAHIGVISGSLTREIENLVPDLLDEIQNSIDALWGWRQRG